MQLPINPGNDLSQIFRLLVEAVVVDVDNEHLAFVVGADPCLLALVQAREIIEANSFFIFTSALTNVVYQCRH